MKILCVAPSYWPAFQYGGPIQSLHLLNKSLNRKGFEITVFTTNAGITNFIDLNSESKLDGIKVIYFSYTKGLDFIGATGWNFSIPMVRALRESINNYDIVYILSIWNFTTAAAAYFSRANKIPYVISPRGQLYEDVMDKKSWKKYPYFKLISERDLANAHAIHYTTLDEYESVHKRLNLKNEHLIIPNGIDYEAYREIPNKDSFYNKYPHLKDKEIMLFLGRLNWKKGIDLLIHSLPQIIKKNKNAHLVIAGNDEGNYKSVLIEILHNQNIHFADFTKNNVNINDNAKVTFTGYLDEDNKKLAMTNSKLFVLTSYSENFGMSVVESMACGLPVVISNKVGIYKDIEAYSAGLISDLNTDDIANKIILLLEDQSLRNKLIKNAIELVKQNYDINKTSEVFGKSIEVLN